MEEHKETVEELYSEVFSKYASYSRHDYFTFQEVDKLLETNRLYEKNNKCLLIRSSTELETDLSKYLKSLEEYKIQLPDFTSVLRETYGSRNVAAYIDIATSSHASVRPNIFAGLESVLERSQPKLHFSFTSILEQAREKEPKLLQEFSREEKSDFHSVMQNFRDQNQGGVVIRPRVNSIDSTNPNFSRIMNNAFAGSGGRTTVNIANIVNANAQTQAGGSIYRRDGQAAGNSGEAGNSGGDDGGTRYGGGKNAKHAN